ncbi:retrovirus-related Pol polyprotein from transposon 297 [Ixodes scapularis]
MDTVLSGLKWQNCLVYLDDVVVFASEFDEHLRRLRAVLQAFKAAGLTLKPSKCRFAHGELKFSSHVVSAQGTNGLTERLNKTITDMVSMYVDVEHKTWDEVLLYVTFAYNTAVQETTGMTLFQLVHGRPVTMMLDAMLPHVPTDDGNDDAQLIAQRAEEACQLARIKIQEQQRVDAR